MLFRSAVVYLLKNNAVFCLISNESLLALMSDTSQVKDILTWDILINAKRGLQVINIAGHNQLKQICGTYRSVVIKL